MTTASQDLTTAAITSAPSAIFTDATALDSTALDSAPRDSATSHRSDAWQARLSSRVAIADVTAVLVAAITAATLLRFIDSSVGAGVLGTVAGVGAATWLCLSAWARRHDRGLTVDGLVRYLPPVTSAAAGFVAACVALALLGAALPVELLVTPFAVGAAAGLVARGAVRGWAARAHSAGVGRRTVLLIGSSAEISALGPALAAIGDAVEVIGACVTDETDTSEILLDYETHSKASVRTVAVLGTMDRGQQIAESLGVDAVLLASARHAKNGDLSALAWQLDRIGTSLSILSSTNDIDDSRVQREVIGNTTLVHIGRPTYRGALTATKRLVDVALSAAMLTVLGLPMLMIAAVIRLSSKGGALFTQTRVGLNGKHFTMLKFRSMVADAEDRRAELADQQDAGNAVMFKMKDDPRVTAIGRLLRTTSLDELPQLINVLRGDMSLVGPRPPLPEELSQYGDAARRRFLVKPGITGLWQVSGRSDLTWEQTVRCDQRYVENWSLPKDASILARTVRAMNKGAY